MEFFKSTVVDFCAKGMTTYIALEYCLTIIKV